MSKKIVFLFKKLDENCIYKLWVMMAVSVNLSS